MKVWESPFIPSHLTFKKFRISLIQSHNNETKINLSIYYNIPKFRILGCYKPTTLKMNLVLEIRRGQKEIGQVWGLLARVLVRKVRGATTLKKQGHGSNKLRYFLWSVDNVCLFTYPTIAPSPKLFCQKHRVFLRILGRFVKVVVRPRLDLLS